MSVALRARGAGTRGLGDPFTIGAIASAIPGILSPITNLVTFFAGGDERAREQQLRAREQQIRAHEAELEAQESAGKLQTVLVIGGGALLIAGLAVVLGTRKKAVI